MSFIIKNDDTGCYLIHNKTLFKETYDFKQGKHNASTFDKKNKKIVLRYLRSEGYKVSAKTVNSQIGTHDQKKI